MCQARAVYEQMMVSKKVSFESVFLKNYDLKMKKNKNLYFYIRGNW